MATNQTDPKENTPSDNKPEGSTSQERPNSSLPDANEKPDPFEELAQSEIGSELYDYGDGGGPDASSSGLRSEEDRSEDRSEE